MSTYEQHLKNQEVETRLEELATFAETSVGLWRQQQELNEVLYKQTERHGAGILELMHAIKGLKELITDHEARLIKIEKSLKEETIYRGFDLVKN